MVTKKALGVMDKPVSSLSIERQELEDNLRSKLEDASTRYKSAHASYRKELKKESEGRGNATGALSGAREEESQGSPNIGTRCKRLLI